jgi:Kef-type K+ transport system membrane component KefB
MRRALAVGTALGLLVAIVSIVRGAGAGEESFVLRGLLGDFLELDRRSLAIGLSLGFTLVGGWLAGELVATVGLPRVSGYLVFGLVFGASLASILPGVAPLVPEAHRGPLRLVDSLAIALIALMAGGEIRIAALRRLFRAALTTTAAELLIVAMPIGLAVALVAPWVGPVAGLAAGEALFLGMTIGLLAVGNSPAIVIAIIKETGARGPMRDAVLTTTVAKDLVLIVLATALFAVGAGMLAPSGAGGGIPLGGLAWHLLGSLAVGVAMGVASTRLVEPSAGRIGLLVAALGLAIASVAVLLDLSPLLVGLAAGFVQANAWPERSSRLFRNVPDLLIPVSVVFFANAGASIDLRALGEVWLPAAAIVIGRLVLKRLAVTPTLRRAGLPEPAASLAWTGFIAQAGVSLALVREFEASFGGFDFVAPTVTVLIATIAFHELIGPPLFAWGLRRAGEIPGRPA